MVVFEWLFSINPNPDFLSDIAAYEGTILALFVPLIMEILSRISERYNSDVLTRIFERRWENKLLPYVLLITIVTAVVLRFAVHDGNSYPAAWKIIGWTLLAVFVSVALLIGLVIVRFKDFVSNAQLLIDGLYKNVEKSIECKEDITTRQAELIQSFEGIGDILVAETKRLKNKIVLDGLKKIRNFVNKMFEIKQNDPDRFEQLIFSQDFLEHYNKDKDNAMFSLWFYPEKHSIGFSSPINQITRIHEAAMSAQNVEISRHSVSHIIYILKDIARTTDNGLFVEVMLRTLGNVLRTAVEKGDPSMYAAAAHWYIDIVFNRRGEKEKNIDLAYIDNFNNYLFSIVKFIISNNRFEVFKAFVSYIIDNVPDVTYNYVNIDKYENILALSHSDVLGKRSKLNQLLKEIDTKEKLNEWLNEFGKIKAKIKSNLTEEQLKEVENLKKEEDAALLVFKYNNLRAIVFSIGAYCLFKEKPSYIKYLWNYKQPKDSDAIWVGHDITMNTIDKLTKFYFKQHISDLAIDSWEDHHGSEIYHQQYFLLRLAAILENIKPNSEGKFSEIENFGLPNLDSYRLRDLESPSIDELISIANNLKGQKSLLAELGFQVEKSSELFDNKLIPLLQKAKESASRKLSILHKTTKISPKKVEEFKNNVLEDFYKSSVLRNVFICNIKQYEDKTTEKVEGKVSRLGYATVMDKALFFDEWYLNFMGWNPGDEIARDEIARRDNVYLFDEIAKGCQEISKEEFEATLQKFSNPEDIILFATNLVSYEFKGSDKFKFHLEKNPQRSYEFNGKLIPVFEFFYSRDDYKILILNKTKLGQLIQLSPLNEGEDKSLVKDIFYMNIQAFSENPELTKRYIKEPPQLLQKIGDEQKQREHLQTRALIEIYGRVQYKPSPDFEGYKLILNVLS
ncbi:hypothetical protein MCHI_001345 [Candidatus Magnetoovum chiemensis]|nr:hypothetical protein MCHI_001345 [Candidatus Magnetoovum chiemensis]